MDANEAKQALETDKQARKDRVAAGIQELLTAERVQIMPLVILRPGVPPEGRIELIALD